MPKGPTPRPPEQRFWEKVDKTDGCWNWTASRAGNYGGFWISGQGKDRVRAYAHRYSYELAHGPIPDDLVVNHLCENKLCVRPDHLEVVTQRENNLYGDHPAAVRARQDTCIHGHPLDGIRPNGTRKCRTCDRLRSRKYAAKRRELKASQSPLISPVVDKD